MITTLFLLLSMARPIELDPQISQIAQKRAEYLYTSGQWSHEGYKRLLDGTDCAYRGEVLAKGFTEAKDVHNAFMNSKTHKAVLLNPKYTKVGIGYYKGIIAEEFCGK